MMKNYDGWEYVESKGGNSKLTKAQRSFKRKVERKGLRYVIKRKTEYSDIFNDFSY